MSKRVFCNVTLCSLVGRYRFFRQHSPSSGYLTLMMEIGRLSETSLHFYQTTWRYFPKHVFILPWWWKHHVCLPDTSQHFYQTTRNSIRKYKSSTYREDGGGMILWKVGELSPHCTASDPRKQKVLNTAVILHLHYNQMIWNCKISVTYSPYCEFRWIDFLLFDHEANILAIKSFSRQSTVLLVSPHPLKRNLSSEWGTLLLFI